MIADPDIGFKLKEAAQQLHQGNARECLNKCSKILITHPNNADAYHLLALSYRALKETENAYKTIRRAMSLASNNSIILNTSGLIHLENGNPDAARRILRKAEKLDGSRPEIYANLGHVYNRLEKPDLAEENYRKALELDPKSYDAFVHLALLLRKQRRLNALNTDYSYFLAQQTADPGILMIKGLIAIDEERYEDSRSFLTSALKMLPKSAMLWSNLGLVESRLGHSDSAKASCKRAVELAPDLAEAHLNLADLYKYEEPGFAREHLLTAIKLQPNHAVILDMIGFTYFIEQKFDQSIQYYSRALTAEPNFDTAAYHMAGAYFQIGDFNQAWNFYSLRYGQTGVKFSPVGASLAPLTTPPSGPGSLLVWTDQGVGDEILQLGCVSDAYADGVPLVIATSERLKPITTRSFPNAKCISNNELSESPRLLEGVTLQTPAFTLASFYRKKVADFPRHDFYLRADQSKSAALRNKYLALNQQKKLIGLSWKSASQLNGNFKSIPLKNFKAILETKDCAFVILQYGDVAEEIRKLPEHISSRLIIDSDIDPLLSLDDFANQVRALDAVITTSNATAHMAGALGVPTWNLVPKIGPGWLWYWFCETDDNLWYPSMRISRQESNSSWDRALKSVQKELAILTSSGENLTGN
ncbi:MAG: tetratricopeptide repeat protein [Rhodospirillaceae bacterium]